MSRWVSPRFSASVFASHLCVLLLLTLSAVAVEAKTAGAWWVIRNGEGSPDRPTRDRNVPAEFQRIYPCPSTGKTTGPCPTHVRDHVIPLACGGPDSVANMVWQTVEEGKRKDLWERECWRWWQP